MMIEKDNCVANKKRNVYWFLIDGLSPQHLAICGNNRVKPNYFDEILGKGIVFSQVISTAGGTHCSMHSQFSSLMPSVNGAVGWVLQSYRNFDKNIMTVADYFKLDGYDTFFYCDCEKERALPTTGFDVWETGNHVIGEALSKTDMMSTIRRECFIGEVIRDEKPKFVYYHSLLLHELNGRLGTFWPHEVYENNIATVAENFRDMIRAFHVTNEDIVIISSDHGVGLDRDYLRDGEIYGERQTEESAICLWSIIGLSDKHPKVLPDMISALDLAPTLLHLVLGKKIPSQGTDRYEYIKKGKYEPYPCFREKGTWANLKLRDCFHSDVFYVREKNWKYVYSMTDVRSEWLMDLDADGDYVSNLKDDYKDKVAYFRNLIELNIKKYDWRELYRHAGTKKASLVLESELLYFSVVFLGKLSELTLVSLLDLAGPYYELILNADCLDEAQRKKCEGDYRVKIVDGLSVGKLSSICRGRLVVLLKKDITYSEYFLSDLYRFMHEHGEQNIKLNENGYLLQASDLEMSDEEYFRNIGTKTSGKRLRIEESERVIIFGAGGNGLEAARYLGMENIMFYCDNDVKKIGQTLGRILIISPDELAKLPRTYPVVVSPYGSRGEDIVLQLKNMGIHKWIRWPDVCRERLTADDLMDM